MLQRIGYNIDSEHAGSNRQYAADSQIALHSTYTLLLDDHKSGWFIAKQIKARSPETKIIHRAFMRKDANGGWDGNLWEAPNNDSPTKFLDAPNYLNFLQGLGAPSGTIHQVLCEPAVHGARLKAKNDWLITCIREASRRKEILCVDNLQTVLEGFIDDVNNGDYDELWLEMWMHPEHIYGIHEYAKGDLWCNTSEASMAMLAARGSVTSYADDFLESSDATLKHWYTATPKEAHLGRCEVIAQRCAKIKRPDGTIGIPVPKMVYTEIGWDDVRIAEKDAVDAINGRVAMGFPTMAQYWHIRYPNWSWAEAAKEQIKWLNRAMPNYVVGACLFGFDTAFENGNYHLEQSGENGLQALLKKYADEVHAGTPQTPTTPVPAPPSTPPVVTLPPVIPSPEPHAWQKLLTDEQRTLFSRAKAGELSGVEDLILKLGELLDTEYNKL
jgi:hypothetical protein